MVEEYVIGNTNWLPGHTTGLNKSATWISSQKFRHFSLKVSEWENVSKLYFCILCVTGISCEAAADLGEKWPGGYCNIGPLHRLTSNQFRKLNFLHFFKHKTTLLNISKAEFHQVKHVELDTLFLLCAVCCAVNSPSISRDLVGTFSKPLSFSATLEFLCRWCTAQGRCSDGSSPAPNNMFRALSVPKVVRLTLVPLVWHIEEVLCTVLAPWFVLLPMQKSLLLHIEQ